MGKILEMDFFSISFYKIKDFLKRNKKRIFFIGLLLILFFILFENGLADPATDPKVDSKNLASKLGEMVDKFFEQIMTQLAIMIAKLSSAVLAITALLFIIDVLLKVMGALGDFNLWSFLGASLQGFIMFGVIMFLLMPTSHTVTAGGVSAAINNYQLITMGTPDFKQKSLLTGFLEMGKQFFADDKMDMTKPSQVLLAVFGIPFLLWNTGVDSDANIPWSVQICFMLLSIFSLFAVISISKDLLMAFINYVLVVGLSVILLPFLIFAKTASLGSQVITNIINKGLSLAIRIGLVGIVISIIKEITLAYSQASDPSVSASATPPTTGSAFQISFVLMIGMFIATEGGQVAEAVLNGKLGNFSVGAFVGAAIGKGAAVLAAAYKGGKTLSNKYKDKKENEELDKLNKEHEDVKATESQRMAEADDKIKNEKANIKDSNSKIKNATKEASDARDAKEKLTKDLQDEQAKGANADKGKIASLKSQISAESKKEDKARKDIDKAMTDKIDAEERLEKAVGEKTQSSELIKSSQSAVNTVKEDFAKNKQDRDQKLRNRFNAIKKGSETMAGFIGGEKAATSARTSFATTEATIGTFATTATKLGGLTGNVLKSGYGGLKASVVYSGIGARLLAGDRDQAKMDLSNRLKMDFADKFNNTRDKINNTIGRVKDGIKGIKPAMANVGQGIKNMGSAVANDLGSTAKQASGKMTQEGWTNLRNEKGVVSDRDDKWEEIFCGEAQQVVSDYKANNPNAQIDDSNFANMSYGEIRDTLRASSDRNVRNLEKVIKKQTAEKQGRAKRILASKNVNDIVNRAKVAQEERDARINRNETVSYD